MDYSDPVHFANAGKAIANTLIKASRTDALDAVAADLAAAFGGQVAGTYQPRDDHFPGWGVWAVGDWIWVFIEGCSFLQHGTATAAGYLGGLFSLADRARNDYFFATAGRIANEIRTRPAYATAKIRFVGHSLGGGIAEATALLVKHEVRIASCAVCTYGAPKFGNVSDCEAVRPFAHARWFNNDDPVPLVFPAPADVPALLLTLTTSQVIRASVFTQPAGGFELLPTGTIRAGTYPTAATEAPVANIGAWLLSLDSQTDTPHDLPEYVHRFNLFLSRDVAPSSRPRPSTVIAPPEDTNRVNLTRQQSAVINLMRDQEQEQRATRLVIPPQRLVVVKRFGPLYRVTWNGQVLSICTRKKTALRLKNVANAFLQSLLRMGVVEPQTLLSQMADFMNAAKQPTSGISPQLSTTLPE